MSKALVIRGADFSANAVAQVDIELPYDAEVSYLQGDGVAYIETGIIASSNTKFEIEVNVQSASGSIGIIGARTGTYTDNLIAYYGSGGDNAWNWRYGTQLKNFSHGGATGDFTVSNIDNVNVLVVSGSGSGTGNVSANAETFTSVELYLFCWNKDDGTVGGVEYSDKLKIKKCKIWSGDTLVRNYIPVRVGTTGYLYDRVSRTLFGNAASSGAFVLGVDK